MARPTEYLNFEGRLDQALLSDGKICLPNVKEIEDPIKALSMISSARILRDIPYRFRVREFDPPLNGKQTHMIAYYAKIFTSAGGMGGRFDGQGVIISGTKAFHFQMCEHDWDTSGANHTRGWHPKVCRKCGFDASIDSGD